MQSERNQIKSEYEEDTYARFCGSSPVSALTGSGEVRSERWFEPDEPLSALYDQRSAKVSVSNLNGTETESTIKSQSLQVPINIRYAVGLGSVANLFAFAGPQFGFNLGDKNQKILNDAANWTLRSSNVSANLGIGATILGHVQVTANYNFALGKTGEVELWDATKKTWDAFTDGKASSWQVSAAYFF